MSKTYNYRTAGTLVVTTTGTINDLDVQGCGTILMNNATLSTITGFSKGYPGQVVNIISIGAGQVDFAHQNASSSAINRLINIVTSANTSLASGVGNSTYTYDDVTNRWRLIKHTQGAKINIVFSAGNFTASIGSTWTLIAANQIEFSYTLVNNLLFCTLTIDSSSVGGTPQRLRSIIPGGFNAATTALLPIRIDNNGAFSLSMAETDAGANTAIYYADVTSSTNWATSSSNTAVAATLTVPVQ